MDYKARFYSPYINHFIQPDSIVSNPRYSKSFNRYSYVNNSPINFNDPSGHEPICNRWGWCEDAGDDYLILSLTTDLTSISANLYDNNGNRTYSQQIDDRTGLCGSVSFSAILRTQYPSLTGNEIIN